MLVDLDDLERLQNNSMVTKGVAAAAIDSSCGFIGTGGGRTAAGTTGAAGAGGAGARAGRAPQRRSASYTHGSRGTGSSCSSANGSANGAGMIGNGGNGNGFPVTKAWAGVGGTLAEFDLSLDLDGPAPAPLPPVASVRRPRFWRHFE